MKTRNTVPIDELTPHPDNVREGDIGAISQSLEAHGQYRPIVVQESSNRIIAGNHTWKAAKALGWTQIAATFIDVDDEQAYRIMLVDNRTNDIATYDDRSLADLLVTLAETPTGLAGTGYDGDDLDLLLADLAREDEDPDEGDIIEVPANPVTQPGDLWQLDQHRVICGDAADPAVWAKLCNGMSPIAVAVTSPPYADRRDYDKSSGFKPIPPDEYVEWFRPIAANVADSLAEDGSWFVNIKAGVAPGGMDTEMYVTDLVVAHVREWGWHFATEFCWERNGVPKSVSQRFKNQFEPVYQFTKSRWKMRPDNVRHHSDNVPETLGEGVGGSYRGGLPTQPLANVQGLKKRKSGTTKLMSDVQGSPYAPGEYIGPGLAYPGNRLPTFAGSHTALGHAAAFPVGLAQFFIEAYTDPGDITCDPFAGTGSSLIAAHNTDRIGLAIELSPAYCDVIIERYKSVNPTAVVTKVN